MPCYHPVKAFRTDDGSISFSERSGGVQLQFQCGRCIGCRLERAQSWALRCVHEAQLHKRNVFVTLTYDDKHLPPWGDLVPDHLRLFLRRVRRAFGKVRYYGCGEYGDLERPHYHAVLFGVDFDDKVRFSQGESGSWCYVSAQLASLWPMGHATCGTVTGQSAGYVARYCLKKVGGDEAMRERYGLWDSDGVLVHMRPPEFARMSRRPGIGGDWLWKFGSDISNDGQVALDGKLVKVPRYYGKRLAVLDPLKACEIEFARFKIGARRAGDATPERLAVRERVHKARVTTLKRGLS